jgi:hypothetical protein
MLLQRMRLRAGCILAGLLVGLPAFAAEESIAISDSLAAHADQLIVKEGGQGFGQINKWSIGDHAVISSKLHATHVTSKSNLLNTKLERHSTTEFTFVMCNPTADSVSVTAVRRAMDESRLIPPAMGYEFLEDGHSICALQTFGGRSLKNSRRVWMHRELDAGMKLVLAAAMTTILEIESSRTGLEPPDEDNPH